MSEILDHLWNVVRVVRLVQVSLFWSFLPFSFVCFKLMFSYLFALTVFLYNIYIVIFLYIFMLKALEGNLD